MLSLSFEARGSQECCWSRMTFLQLASEEPHPMKKQSMSVLVLGRIMQSMPKTNMTITIALFVAHYQSLFDLSKPARAPGRSGLFHFAFPFASSFCLIRRPLRFSSHTRHPISTRSSSQTRSRTLAALAKRVSSPHSTSPERLNCSVTPNQKNANNVPVRQPTSTWRGVW